MVPTPFDQKAFALAYALSFPSREIAIAILKSARIRAVEIRREQEHRRIALRSWRRYHSLRRLLDPYRPDFAAATCLQVAICEVTTAWEQCQEQGGLLWGEELKNPARLATRLQTARDPLSQYLHAHIAAMPQQSLVDSLNGLLRQAHVWQPQRWARVSLTPQLLALTNQNLLGAALIRRNRLLLEAAYPGEIVPHWGPTLEDLLVRYVKYLSWYAMIRGSRHVAVGLGCLLYRYAPSKMVRLFPMTVSSPGRLKKRLTEALKTRFPDLNPESARQPHDANERTRVLRWLWMLAPWSPSCHSHPASRPTALFDTNAPAWECADRKSVV